MRNAEGTSVEEYQGRFRRFALYDFLLGCYNGAMAIGGTGPQFTTWNVDSDWDLTRILRVVVSLLFFLDGVLIVRLTCSAIPSFSRGSTSAEKLARFVNLNFFANAVTFCIYVAMECYVWGDELVVMAKAGISGAAFLITLPIIVAVLLKALKIGVLSAFRRKVLASANSSSPDV